MKGSLRQSLRSLLLLAALPFLAFVGPAEAKSAKLPTPKTAPSISGGAVVGQTLTASAGSWSGSSPIGYAYRWQRCDSSATNCGRISGATAASYQLVTADTGSTIRVVVTASNAAGSASATSPATSTIAAGVPPPPSGSVPSLGVNFHCGWTTYTDPDRVAVLDKMKAAGIKWVRIDIGWSTLEWSGRYDISSWYVDILDRCISLARQRGINVLAMLHRTPPWANGGQALTAPPSDVSDYAWIAHWAAVHFRGRIAAWEVWNEPNQPSFWTGTVSQYVQLLKAAYPAFKSGDPSALVVFGGPSYNDDAYISAAYQAGAKGSFDVMATHPYQGMADYPPEYPDGGNRLWFTHLPSVRAVMDSYGDANKPIWFTEFGWSSHANWPGIPNGQRGVTDAQQADYLVRAIDYTRAHYPYVPVMFWYDERSWSFDDVHEAGYGLLNPDLTPRLLYSTLKSYLTGS